MKLRATVAYDGSGFHGFAPNPGVPTVGGAIERALSTVARTDVTVVCAGRTDKGVHGRGQVVSFELPDGMDADRVERSVNHLCRPAIVLRDTEIVGADFDARFSARWRRYRFVVLNSAGPDPLEHGRVWHVSEPLDVERMNAAASAFVGIHDFTSFCRRPKLGPGEVEPSMVREVLEATWVAEGERITFWVRATSFCHQMVRSLVGTCVDVGRGRIEPADVPYILAARDRAAARPIAPPGGLTLWEVGY